MISEAEEVLLSQYFAQIPTHGDIQAYSIERPTVDEFAEQAGIDGEDQSWIRFFERVGNTENSELRLNSERFVEELTESISNNKWLAGEPVFDKIDEELYTIKLPFKQRGEVELQTYFSGDTIEEADASLIEKKLSIWTIEPRESILSEETAYSWRETIQEGFLEGLRTDLDQIFGADLIELCSQNSPAFKNEPEGVEDSIEFYAKLQGLNPEVRPSDVERAEILNHINHENIIKFISDGDGWIILCNCELNADNIHFHYFESGSPTNIADSTNLKRIRKKGRNKIKKYNSHLEGKKDIQGATRSIGTVLAIAGAVEILPLAAMISFFGISTDSDTFTIILLLFVGGYVLTGIGLLIYLVSPAIKFNLHSWERRGIREYLSDLV